MAPIIRGEKSRPQQDRPREMEDGFTLIALLVVISIIAIVAGLFLPALSRSKSKSQSIVCANNLKQLTYAWFLYPNDHEDWLAPNISLNNRGQPGSWVLGSAQTDLAESNITTGALYPYDSALGIYRCPADHSTVAGTSTVHLRSYTLDGWLHAKFDNVDYYDYLAEPHKFSNIQKPGPAQVFTFIEEHPDSITAGIWYSAHADPYDSLMRDGNPGQLSSDIWDSFPTDRHNQGADLSFADGHVTYHRWKSPKRFQFDGQTASPDGGLEDLRYMQMLLPRLR